MKHSLYKPKILTSKGIGATYIKHGLNNRNKYREQKTIETYKTQTGHETALPTYYRNHTYTDDEKEKLWLQKIESDTRYIGKQKFKITGVDTQQTTETINQIKAQTANTEAQTALTKVQEQIQRIQKITTANKISGVDTQQTTETINQIKAQTANTEAQTALTKVQEQIQRIQKITEQEIQISRR